MNNKEQWLVDQYNRNRLVEDHIDNVKDIPKEVKTTYLPFLKGGGEPK